MHFSGGNAPEENEERYGWSLPKKCTRHLQSFIWRSASDALKNRWFLQIWNCLYLNCGDTKVTLQKSPFIESSGLRYMLGLQIYSHQPFDITLCLCVNELLLQWLECCWRKRNTKNFSYVNHVDLMQVKTVWKHFWSLYKDKDASAIDDESHLVRFFMQKHSTHAIGVHEVTMEHTTSAMLDFFF